MIRIFFAGFCILLAACGGLPKQADPFVGTWCNFQNGYYLRVYPDGRVAQWPSPLEGAVSWSSHKNGELQWRYLPPLKNPVIRMRGRDLVIDMTQKEMPMERLEPDLEPGQILNSAKR